jgi:serpin B
MTRRRISWLVAGITTLALLISACGSDGPSNATPVHALRATAARAKADNGSPAVKAATAADLAFAVDLYRTLSPGKDNVWFSPTSISIALSMVTAGAQGATQAQLRAALHQTLPAAQVDAAMNALDQGLTTPRDGLKLNVANSLWAQNGFAINQPFLTTLARDYGAGVNTVDFAHATEAARQTINSWTADHTNGKITDLLPRGSVDAATRMTLVNAVYFNGKWQTAFDPKDTGDTTFHALDGSSVKATMMHENRALRYATGSNWQAVDVPYKGNASMTLILPKDGDFATFDHSLTAATLTAVLHALDTTTGTPTSVSLGLPKVELHSTISLASQLNELGIKDAFDPNTANFHGITNEPLYLSNVFHQATLHIDEAGTEAATAGVFETTSAQVDQVTMNLDRPFYTLIRDDATGEVLFFGRIANPKG